MINYSVYTTGFQKMEVACSRSCFFLRQKKVLHLTKFFLPPVLISPVPSDAVPSAATSKVDSASKFLRAFYEMAANLYPNKKA